MPSAELFSSEVGVTSDSATLLVIDKESFELVTLFFLLSFDLKEKVKSLGFASLQQDLL